MSGKRILFIDDEIYPDPYEPSGNYMLYYLEALRQADYDLTPVDGADKALEAIEHDQPFDLILLDIMMPPGRRLAKGDSWLGMRTGLLLAREIASLRSSLPIIVLTNVNNPDTMAELRKIRSVKRFLQKVDYPPFELVAILSDILEECV